MAHHMAHPCMREAGVGQRRPVARGRAASVIAALALSVAVTPPAGAAMPPYYIEALRARGYPGGAGQPAVA